MADSASTLLMSDTESIIKPEVEKQPEKETHPVWWYIIGAPAIPTISMVALIAAFRAHHSHNWNASPSDDFLSDGTCSSQYNDAFQRRFMMDITFGSYTFATAKLIDVAWDTIIGQCGRLLHAWLLYRHVARKLLVGIMEHSSVTYDDYIAITFSQSFSGALTFFIRMLFQRNKLSVWLCLVGLTYMLVYTFLFSTIWGTATGYISPAIRVYHMPDQSYLPLDSDRLALCWSIDSERLGLPPGRVELGPKLSQLDSWLSKDRDRGTWSGFTKGQLTARDVQHPLVSYDFNGWNRTIWDDIGPAGMNLDIPLSNASRQIFDYAFTSRIFQVVFNESAVNTTGYNTEIDLPSSDDTAAISFDFYHDPTNVALDVTRYASLYAAVNGYEYKHLNWTQKSSDDVQYVQYFNTWPMFGYPAYYVLNDSVAAGPGVIPYNSTFQLDGTAYSLEAPFLDIGYECSHPFTYFTALGNCICYDGTPLTVDWYRGDNVVCLDSPIYTFGFSSYIVFVGLICETIWIVFALWIRGYCQLWCKLTKHDRVRRAGVIRSVLELAEAVQRDLGEEIALTEEHVLRDRLAKFGNIGYTADYDEFGTLQGVRIVSRDKKLRDFERDLEGEGQEINLEDGEKKVKVYNK